MRVLVQLRPSPDIVAAVLAAGPPPAGPPPAGPPPADMVGDMPGLLLDPDYAPVAVPRPMAAEPGADPFAYDQPLTFSAAADDASVVVRGEIPDDDVAVRLAALGQARRDVVGVFADPVIETCLTCGGSPAVGDWHDVERLLAVPALARAGLDGTGVALAIVDTGVNRAHLEAVSGRPVTVDLANSWTPAGVPTGPGAHPVDHGTMCAFDALIAAPRATILDVAVLLSRRQGETVLSGLLSDAVAAYAHLRRVLDAMPADGRRLVVSNSWGSFSPRWDFPVGHPGNYSDNRAHPFNVIVASLEAAGADILFAAGNCGRDCPDGRCQFGTARSIGGANSHPKVLSVGGIDTTRTRVGYSSQGPGRLTARKPDLCAYTHFTGSDAFAGDPDSGTSAACPVAAGVLAAVRTMNPASALTPRQLRTLARRTADDLGSFGYDDDHGYGAIDPAGILARLRLRRTPAPRPAAGAPAPVR
jgi:subtilisin family serine protease